VAEKTIHSASTAIGYLCVSMTDQNLEKNKAEILQLPISSQYNQAA
jgi:hypothetical protein